MDCARHPDSCRRHDALRRSSTRDRRNFSENAHPDPAQPRARRPGATHSTSGCAAESRIFSYEAGTHVDRAAPGTLSLVGKTSRRASSEPHAGQTNGDAVNGAPEFWISEFHHSITSRLDPLV